MPKDDSFKEALDFIYSNESDDKAEVLDSFFTGSPLSAEENLNHTKSVIAISKIFDTLPRNYQKTALEILIDSFSKKDLDLSNYDEEEMSLSETAKILGKTSRTLHNWLKEGKIKGKKRENRWFFTKEEIMKHMK